MRIEPPLYDPAFEHDACGVGFVADAGRRSGERVLPLALAGLAALGHRGALAADGESSDGAGVALPLERAVRERIGASEARSGVVMAFLPRPKSANRLARRIVEDALVASELALEGWRDVPVDPGALGAAAAASRPAIAQALVRPAAGRSRRVLDRRLILARHRMEAAGRAAGLREFAVASASTHSIVYKGLVGGGRLAEFYLDLAGPLQVSYAVFHLRFATNTHPVWRLAQPFRAIAHNGGINTVRGNREQVRGRTRDVGRGAFGRRALGIGPLLSPDGSDSLSLDEMVEMLVAAGWSLEAALLAAVPEAPGLELTAHPLVALFQERTAGLLAPWDGPAALVFADGRRVGALQDRNGLRPAAYAISLEGLVALASEAGAVPLGAAETVRRGRLGPGEMLLVDPGAGAIHEDEAAKTEVLRGFASPARARPSFPDRLEAGVALSTRTPAGIRYLAGLDAERSRLSIRTMVVEGHEPLWSMGDDTPTPANARLDRPVADHLRQSFAQVTNPPIDPDRERVVIDLHVELGRRPPLLGRLPAGPATLRLDRPHVVDLVGLRDEFVALAASRGLAAGSPIVTLDATWDAVGGPGGLEAALDRLAAEAVRAARGEVRLVVVSDRSIGIDRLPVPSVLGVGAVHTALTAAGLRGRADVLADAADILDIHGLAMALASGATAACPWLAIELATELPGSRGLETLTQHDAITNLVASFDAALRKVLARMGISCVASYVGGHFFDVLELSPPVVERCFPGAPAWAGSIGFAEIATRQLRRREIARGIAPAQESHRLPDPGFVRFRSDGEAHLFAPAVIREIQALANNGAETLVALERYRSVLARSTSLVRDQLALRPVKTVALDEVEPVESIAPRFVSSAMSLGSLSPEAHQAITLGMQRFGGAANTGEGGEDPRWYAPDEDGRRRDAKIKQIASARFGVTAEYLSRADQLEIKIAQGSKPGEGGQLPGRKATALIAALRRGQPGQAMISPPPHHDIYSIEDLAQLIADLRAVNPRARIGVKLVAGRGIGTIAAGVAKTGADYIHVSGHAGGTGASPLSSIKHAGLPWELGLAEVHQVLMRNDLRDRVSLRVDGGLQSGRDLLMAALLGAEEFGFGTSALVAIGCDMARQCHLDTCPTGIATQREELRAKFRGTPEMVEHFFRAVAEDLRRELASIGARTVGDIVGEARRFLRPARGLRTLDVRPLIAARGWSADPARRAEPRSSMALHERAPASELEERLVTALSAGERVEARLELTTADRSFGAMLSGSVTRGEIARPLHVAVSGSAGQSFGAFVAGGIELVLDGQANDYVAKGLSGGTVIVRPEAGFGEPAERAAIAGNTCLYGATGGRLHVVGRAGMRFAVRNSGAEAVVEGLGPHGCEYMTGGVVVVLGPVGANFGAGMTGGRAYLYESAGGEPVSALAGGMGGARLAEALIGRIDARERLAELRRLLVAHAAAGSALAARVLATGRREIDFWLVEPESVAEAAEAADSPAAVHRRLQPSRNLSATRSSSTVAGETVTVF